MFSATGNVLSGSFHRPDIYTLWEPQANQEFGDTQPSKLNLLGYIPGVSTVSGSIRTLLGIIHTIVHLVAAIFNAKNRAYHLKEAGLGVRNIIRGLVEIIPIAGNITCLTYDGIRMKRQAEAVKKFSEANPVKKADFLLFTNHTLIAEKSMDQMNALAAEGNFKSKPTFWETVKLVQS